MMPLTVNGKKPARIRVLCFGRFFDEFPGGIEAHVRSLTQSLKGRVDFVNLVPSRNSQGARLLMDDGTPVVRTPSWNVDGSLALSPLLIYEAWRLHRQQPFDLVHLHFPDPMSHLASMILPSSLRRVISWHSDVVRQKRLLMLYQPWQRRILQQASAVLVATPSHIKSSTALSDASLHAKLRVVPYGIDSSRFSAPVGAADAIRNQYHGKLIFSLGRHVSYKGFDVLLDAMAHLEPDIQLLLGGIGPLTESLKERARELRLSERVHFLGVVPDEALPAFYQACDVFCLPSVTQAEAFGIVQVEAMAAGKPVVSTRLGNGVDFVNQHELTGLTVSPGDAEALAGALQSLFSDPERRARLGANARERARTEFSMPGMGGRVLQIYQEILSSPTGRLSAL